MADDTKGKPLTRTEKAAIEKAVGKGNSRPLGGLREIKKKGT